jgi:hypothetical protein
MKENDKLNLEKSVIMAYSQRNRLRSIHGPNRLQSTHGPSPTAMILGYTPDTMGILMNPIKSGQKVDNIFKGSIHQNFDHKNIL